ncbi:MAG: EAL domain-containing protein [Betaproteobacteria bacterium]|nr:EAL domain-containing protein [Betaproteobacteria bacterium]
MDEDFLRDADRQLAGWSDPPGRLKEALERDELELYCQPVRALQGPETYPLAEVLVRLREEEKALLPPGEFLPVFEQYRMMPQLDRWVVRRTLKRLAAGSRIPRFSVNVSAQTLDDEDFPLFVRREAAAAGVAPKSLLFELDELDVLAKGEACARFALAMKSLGHPVLIDGFGRRSVTFAPLKSLSLDFLKVDGAITRRIVASPSADNKLKAILRVGQALGIGIVAECVEEQDILVRLRALGVGYVQGFGVYRPHPIDSLAA